MKHIIKDTHVEPVWMRPKEAQRLFGIGRTMLYRLMEENKIKTVSLRPEGARHGTRLISYSSMCSYIESMSDDAN